jgi:AraC-like DNA-binding protein
MHSTVDLEFDLRALSQALIGFQSLFFFIILTIGASPKRWSNWFLGSFFLLLGTQMFVLVLKDFISCSGCIEGFLCVFGFGYGPSLYLFAQSLIYRNYEPVKKDLLHFIPFGALVAGSLFGVSFCSIFGSLLYISILVYLFLTVRSLTSYQRTVEVTQSTDATINLSWFQWMMSIFTVVLLFDLLQHFYRPMNVIGEVTPVEIALLILVNGMFYQGIRQPFLFKGLRLEDINFAQGSNVVPSENQPKYETEFSGVSQYLKVNKLYQKNDLSLAELAGKLDMSARHLSQVINRSTGSSFMDFINTFRINYAKQRLEKPIDPKETIQEVMYESGFNSRSSFNTLFREKTGQTPSEFKRNSKEL